MEHHVCQPSVYVPVSTQFTLFEHCLNPCNFTGMPLEGFHFGLQKTGSQSGNITGLLRPFAL